LGYGERHRLGLRFNEMVRKGQWLRHTERPKQ
jgi:urocanate hydratase